MKAKMRQSTNPLMITSNQSYGIRIEELKHCDLVRDSKSDCDIDNTEETVKNSDCQPTLSFLYTRESDSIGAAVKTSNSCLAKAFDKGKLKGKRRLGESEETSSQNGPNISEIPVEEVQATLENYKHDPKIENPLYTTTSNDIGSKKPSQANFTRMRYSRSQNFSKSFNRIMFQDQGLNTSLTRSNVHEMLDSHCV